MSVPTGEIVNVQEDVMKNLKIALTQILKICNTGEIVLMNGKNVTIPVYSNSRNRSII